MLNPSDKELDRLSREAAEHFEPDMSSLSWEKLSQRLDTELGRQSPPSTRRFGRGPMGYSLLILAVTGLTYFLLKKIYHTENQIKDRIVKTLPTPTAASKSENKEINQSGASTSATQTVHDVNASLNTEKDQRADLPKIQAKKAGPTSTPVLDNHADRTLTGQKHQGAPNALDPNAVASALQNPSTNPSPGAATQTNGDGQLNSSPALGAEQKKAGKSHTVPSDKSGNAIVAGAAAGSMVTAGINNSSKQQGNGNAASAKSSDDGLALASLPVIENLSANSVHVSDASLRNYSPKAKDQASSDADQGKIDSRSLHVNRALKIGLMFAPDITNVHSVAPEKLSSNLGLTVGYEVFDHWSINTGIIYTKKNYSANGEDYHAKPGTIPPNFSLDYVTGNCYMWEIPLTIRYDFNKIGQTLFFVNGGLSSYLMRKENYTYYGHYYSSPGWPTYNGAWPKSYNNHENYWFSMIDFSAGAEARLSKSFTLQVEPFVKIPLQGVGMGKLDLSSYGMMFSLRYAPVLGKSRK